MEKVSFSDIVEHLTEVIKFSQDKRFNEYYAEYLVAFELSKLGYAVIVLGKRRGPDLLVRDTSRNIESFVEVKSSHTDLKDFDCAASFGKGRSIERGDFHCCVFVVFEKLQPIEYLVFTLDEIKEVIEKKRGSFPNNPYLLFRYKSLKEYEAAFPNPEERLEIEMKLHQHPEEFQSQWSKIFSQK